MSQVFRVQRVQECIVSVEDDEVGEGETAAQVAAELAEVCFGWEMVDTIVEPIQ